MTEPENRAQPSRDEPWLRVPASVREPERHRFAQPAPADEIDEDDEDVEFLAALARQAEHEAASRTAAVTAARPRRFNVKADDHLELFRATEVERPRPRVLNSMEVDVVEMDDLLEQLSTTAAALRRRKAA